MIEERRIGFTRRTAIPLFLAPFCTLGQNAASDLEWSRFRTWVQGLAPGSFGNQRDVFAGYGKKMTAEGMTAAEAAALVARLQKRIDSPEWKALNFNRLYSGEPNSGNRRNSPNAFLAETVSTLRPGKALDLGMGEGRNTIFLAQQGWDVLGLDLSDVGIAHANDRARNLGVRINARVQDVDSFDFGTNQWDLICLLYFVLSERQESLYQRITTSLKPGGLVIVEGLGLPAMETLLKAWSKWEPMKLKLLQLEYREGKSDWGGNQFGRLLLQKPA
jgi:SAM-dependent methyltransferase